MSKAPEAPSNELSVGGPLFGSNADYAGAVERCFDRWFMAAEDRYKSGEYHKGLDACGMAERIRVTDGTRDLRKRLLDAITRTDLEWVGDGYLRQKQFANAASCYAEAQSIQVSAELEAKYRRAKALELVESARSELDRGRLAQAEVFVSASKWYCATAEAEELSHRIRVGNTGDNATP
jgi:hypothetical protein